MSVVPTITQICNNVKTVLLTAGGIGKVLNRPRDEVDPAEFQEQFYDTLSGTINAWIVDCVTSNTLEDKAGCLYVSTRTIRVEGFLAFEQQGDSFITFRDLVDSVASKIHASDLIFGEAPLFAGRDTVITLDYAKLGNILCYHCIIDFQVESEETF